MLIYLKTFYTLPFFLVFHFSYIFFRVLSSPAVDVSMERYGKSMIAFCHFYFLEWGLLFAGLQCLKILRVFLIMFQLPDIDTKLPIDEYYDVFFNIHLIFGLSFELPVVLILFGRIGLVSSNFLLAKWRETIVILFFLSSPFSRS